MRPNEWWAWVLRPLLPWALTRVVADLQGAAYEKAMKEIWGPGADAPAAAR